MAAMEVASDRGDGIGPAARHDMEERLFLDRIDMLGAELAVDQAVEDAATIFADGADAAGTVADQAAEAAKPATHLVVALPFIKHGFFHGVLPLIVCPLTVYQPSPLFSNLLPDSRRKTDAIFTEMNSLSQAVGRSIFPTRRVKKSGMPVSKVSRLPLTGCVKEIDLACSARVP